MSAFFLIWSVCWISFSILLCLMIAVGDRLFDTPTPRQTVCIVCGRVIDGPGICSSCAADVEEVAEPVQVRYVLPDWQVVTHDQLTD